MQVKVYYNFHRKNLSIQQNGRVIDRRDEVFLENVTFKVSQSGRERVLREKVKNVHAFICGELCEPKNLTNPVKVRYNPYETEGFVNCLTNEKVLNARMVRIIGNQVYCQTE